MTRPIENAPETTNGVRRVEDPDPAAPNAARHDAAFPIVGIGASAGGLEAFTQLLKQLPPTTGMAFVLIQHLDPTHDSYLREAMAKATVMAVTVLARRRSPGADPHGRALHAFGSVSRQM